MNRRPINIPNEDNMDHTKKPEPQKDVETLPNISAILKSRTSSFMASLETALLLKCSS